MVAGRARAPTELALIVLIGTSPALHTSDSTERAITMLNNNSKWAKSLTAIAVVGLLGACSRNAGEERAAAGTVDSAAARTTATTPAVGPGVQVTRTDAKERDQGSGL